jgi:hypothetical protein
MTFLQITTCTVKSVSAVLLISFLTALQGCTSGESVDPGTTDTPIVYVKRVIPLDNNGDPEQPDLRDPLLFMPGGDAYIKDRASASARERNIIVSITAGIGDVKDIAASYDGKRILFSLRLEDPDENDNIFFTWNIYEYDIEAGFSSTDEDRQTKALVLHVMDNNGGNIRQITFNQSHDLDSIVLDDGRILFSRWDNSGNNNAMHLYTVSPDGSNLQVYYGAHDESHIDADGNTVQLIQPYLFSNGDLLSISQPFTDTFGGGNIVIIDAKNYIDINQPTVANLGALSGPAQTNATVTKVINDGSISPQGRYSSAFPLRDGTKRMLVSKGICQLEVTVANTTETHPCIEPWLSNSTAVELPPVYGIWIYDVSNDTEKPIVIAESGMITTDVVAMRPGATPAVIPDKGPVGLDATLMSEDVGQF